MEASGITKAQKNMTSSQQCKTMLTYFFNSCSMVHHEYALECQTINKEYYLEVLCHLHDAVQRKQPDIWTEKNWQLHHDNALTQSAHVIKGFLAKNNATLVQQPPYCPNLAPSNFWLFPKLKTMLKGMRFQSCTDIIKKTMAKLRSIPEKS